jgi:hypothetical protein
MIACTYLGRKNDALHGVIAASVIASAGRPKIGFEPR